MTIVDTSSWIEALREKGDPAVRARVRNLLEGGDPAWCPIIRLELWRGVRAGTERRALEMLESQLPSVEISADVWNAAIALMVKARGAGLTVPANDVLIVATVRHYGAGLEHCDHHLDRLLEIG